MPHEPFKARWHFGRCPRVDVVPDGEGAWYVTTTSDGGWVGLVDCRGCGREIREPDAAKVWVKTPLGVTVARCHPGCEEIAATALDGKVVAEPVSKAGRVFPSLAPGPKPVWEDKR